MQVVFYNLISDKLLGFRSKLLDFIHSCIVYFLLNMSIATICVLEFGNFIYELFPVISIFVAVSLFICAFFLRNMHFGTY